MAALVIFANLNRQTERLFPQELQEDALRVSMAHKLITLDASFVKFDADTPEIIMVARRVASEGTIFTWVGIYNALDKTISGRDGAYFGAGVLLWSTALPGEFLYKVSKAAVGRLADIFKRNIGNYTVADEYVQAARQIFNRIQPEDLGLSADFPILFAATEQLLQRDAGLGSDPDRGKRGFLLVSDEAESFPEGIDLFQSEFAPELQEFNRAILTKHPGLAEILRGNHCEEIGSSAATDASSHITGARSGSEAALAVGDNEVYDAAPTQAGRRRSETFGPGIERSPESRIRALEMALSGLPERVGRLEAELIQEPQHYSSADRIRAYAKPPAGNERQSILGSRLGDFASHVSLSVLAWLFSVLLIAVACIAVIVIKLPEIEGYFDPIAPNPLSSTSSGVPATTLSPAPPAAQPTASNQTPAVPSNPEPQIDVAEVTELLGNIQGLIPNRMLSALSTIDDAEVSALASSQTLTAATASIEKDAKLRNAYTQFKYIPDPEQFITLLEIEHCLAALKTAPETKLTDVGSYCPSLVNLKE